MFSPRLLTSFAAKHCRLALMVGFGLTVKQVAFVPLPMNYFLFIIRWIIVAYDRS